MRRSSELDLLLLIWIITACLIYIVLLTWLLPRSTHAQEPTTTEVDYGALSQSPGVYTSGDILKFATNLEATAPPGLEDFYDKDYYGPAQIYCTNGYDFDIWIVTKDGAVTVPAKGHFVLTRKED